jgi:UDP-N-acetylmuramate dehydrogenase
MDSATKQELAKLASGPVRWECPLCDYTSFGIGGPAAALIVVESLAELQGVLLFLQTRTIPWRIIGKGSNLLVSDGGFDGVILLLGAGFAAISDEDGVQVDDVIMRVGAACSLSRLVNWCGEQGVSGFEFAAGIPGTIGGAVIMNAGAWGRELADGLVSVTMVTASGHVCSRPRSELDFGYRIWHDYDRNDEKQVVVGVALQGKKADPEQIKSLCRSYRQQRQEKQPKGLLDARSAGSFFKNPPGDAAGRLIEASGLKGLAVGGALVSPVHANFLVNSGGATAANVMELMKRVQDKVYADSGILLEPEVHFLPSKGAAC